MVLGTFPDDYMQVDKANLLDQYTTLTKDIKDAFELGETIDLPKKKDFDHIFFIGMGGSAISGDMFKAYLEDIGCILPVSVIRDYDVPKTLTKDSLVFAISYSGNTEETLSAYKRANRISSTVISLASGGKLEEVANATRQTFIPVPKGYQPRTAALSYLFFPILRVLERYKIIPPQSSTVDYLRTNLAKPDFKKLAISISEKLVDKTPLLYSSSKYFPVAYRCKTQCNENAKVHAFANTYSEMNHNELCALEQSQSPYHALVFEYDDDHRRIKKRMEKVKSMMQKAGGSTTEIKLSGPDMLTKLFTGILIGDLTSFYLALRYERDPSSVDKIEQLKKDLGSYISS